MKDLIQNIKQKIKDFLFGHLKVIIFLIIFILVSVLYNQNFQTLNYILKRRVILEYSLPKNTKIAKDDIKKELIKTAICDELTGLYNRKYLYQRLEAEISRSKRYGTSLACLLVDIDHFKIINDMYGYDWGDILLRKIAQMLSALVRKEDVLTRYGDEEFIVILPETTEQQAMIFAERFRKDVEKMEFIPANEDERHPITISGGVSAFPCMEGVEEDANTLIRYSEHALYNAKQSGKNRIIEFSKMNLG